MPHPHGAQPLYVSRVAYDATNVGTVDPPAAPDCGQIPGDHNMKKGSRYADVVTGGS